MVASVFLRDMVSNVTVQLVSQAVDVKLTSTNAQASLAIIAVLVLTFLKDTVARVPLDMVASIVKKNDLTVETTRVLREQCAKMNQGSITTPAYADPDTLASIVI